MDQNNLFLEKLKSIEQLIQAQNVNLKEVLNFREACVFLDFSASHLYKLTSGGHISYYKPEGKKIYFDRIELINWLKRKRISSNSEIHEIAIKKSM